MYNMLFKPLILNTSQKVFWQTVKTQIQFRIRHFFSRVCFVCTDKKTVVKGRIVLLFFFNLTGNRLTMQGGRTDNTPLTVVGPLVVEVTVWPSG